METRRNDNNSVLHELYTTERHPAGFSGYKKLYKYAREQLPNITLNEVRDWYISQLTPTLHWPARRNIGRNRVFVSAPYEQFQADLTFLKDFAKENNGYKYVLTVIDCFSRKAWAEPLKTKRSGEVKKALQKVFLEGKPFLFQTDKGTEFRFLTQFFESNGIHYFTTKSSEIKCSIVERFNRTLKGKMFKMFTSNGNRVWFTKLGDLLHSYNNSVHRSTKFKPNEVSYKNAHHVFANLYPEYSAGGKPPANKTQQPKLVPGDMVRQKYKLGPFDRGYYPNWTDQVFEVGNNITTERPLYRLNDNETNQRFYPEELLKINPVLYRIREILQSRRRRGRDEILVSWLGYPDSANSWIPASDVTRLHQDQPNQTN